jgi:hypothetical protein
MAMKDKSLLIFYAVLFIASLLIGGVSWWHTGIIPEGENYPNPIMVSMFLYCTWFGFGIVQEMKKALKNRMNQE